MTASPAASGIAAAVFDMDGTLLDTEPLYREAMFQACEELGYAMTVELHAAQIGIPNDGARKLFYDAYGDAFPYETFHPRMHELMHQIEAERGVMHKPGVVALLDHLEARGIPAAVVTSTAFPAAPERLKRAGIFDRFAEVITRQDTSRGKPFPDPFLLAAERLGVAPGDCVAFEDSPNGVRSASGAGMKTVMVPDLVKPTEEISALCVAVIPELTASIPLFFA